MGMTTSIEGFKPPDAKWKKMKAIWDSCEEAGIEIPKKVYDYFEGDEPDGAGVRVAIPYKDYDDGNMTDGIEVDLTKLSRDITKIRFTNSY